MNAPVNPQELALQTVEFKLDGKTIVAYDGETILKAAKRHGVDIPHLCTDGEYQLHDVWLLLRWSHHHKQQSSFHRA